MKRLACYMLTVCVLAVAVPLLGCDSAPNEEIARVIFLDVGQGDCTLIRTQAGDVLIDAGTEDAEQMLCRRLEDLGVTELALAVFTHPDEDHIGGADGVLKRIPTEKIWLPQIAQSVENESYRRLLSTAEATDVEIQYVLAGEGCFLGDVRLFALAPLRADETDSNESSIVLKLVCGAATAILTGDVGERTERELIACYGAEQLSCSLYKAGHHGSSTSSCREFLEALTPTWAIVCCGLDNPYGHPHGEVLDRMEDQGIVVYRTDLLGEIAFTCDGKRFVPMRD